MADTARTAKQAPRRSAGSNLMRHLICRDVLDERAADVAGAVADGVQSKTLDVRRADSMLGCLRPQGHLMMAMVNLAGKGLQPGESLQPCNLGSRHVRPAIRPSRRATKFPISNRIARLQAGFERDVIGNAHGRPSPLYVAHCTLDLRVGPQQLWASYRERYNNARPRVHRLLKLNAVWRTASGGSIASQVTYRMLIQRSYGDNVEEVRFRPEHVLQHPCQGVLGLLAAVRCDANLPGPLRLQVW